MKTEYNCVNGHVSADPGHIHCQDCDESSSDCKCAWPGYMVRYCNECWAKEH